MKIILFWLKYRRNLIPMIHFTQIQHWYRQCLAIYQVTRHYLKWWWPSFLMYTCVSWPRCFNSSPLSAAFMRKWMGSALFQIMACCLFGTKPLSKPMLGYCQLEPKEQSSVKFKSKYKTFHSWKCTGKSCLRSSGHFVQGKMNIRIPMGQSECIAA